jgi:hypothetical protein
MAMKTRSSGFVKHEPCPKCHIDGKRLTFARYDDGHAWCFFCKHGEGGEHSFVKRKENFMEKPDDGSPAPVPQLPSDCTLILPIVARNWLDSYGIKEEDIRKHKMVWSDEGTYVKDLKVPRVLIFPVYDPFGNLLMWQARCFPTPGDTTKYPKYITKGFKQDVHHIMSPSDPSPVEELVIVEDFISALKVSKLATAMPLWGSSINAKQISQLCNRFKFLIIWLDKDKIKDAIKAQKRASQFFDEAVVIYTEKDPKDYAHQEILDILCEALK